MVVNGISEKIILTDCDGVLLDWCVAFNQWMAFKGYVLKNSMEYDVVNKYQITEPEKRKLTSEFNSSAWMGYLTPYKDAVKYVKKLHEEHGYVFHVITSLSNDKFAQKLRISNLENIFGKNIFDDYTFLNTGSDKDQALKMWKGSECYWIEDKWDNAVQGLVFGLKSILISDVSRNFKSEVKTWKEIYEMIT